jgi:hypothetical protein
MWPRKVVFKPSDPSAHIVLQQLISATRDGKLVPWTGAGISLDSPANLFTGAELEKPLKKNLYQAARNFVPQTDRKSLCDLMRQICTFRLEPMLDALQRVHGRDFVENYLALLDGNTWNENHAVLAALANSRFISHCITLNFDCLLELAHEQYGRSTTFCPLRKDDFSTGSGSLQLQIIKPHGSFSRGESKKKRFDLLCGSISEIGGRPSDANRKTIQQVLEHCPTVLVAGYSDHDWDITPILFELREKLDHIFWIEHAKDPQTHQPNKRQKRVRELLRIFAVPSTIIVANTNFLLRFLARKLAVTPRTLPQASQNVSRQHPDASALLETQEDRQRTALATALLLQNGPTRKLLQNELLKIKTIYETPDLHAMLMKAIGMTNYPNVQEMVKRMRVVERLSPQTAGRLRTDDNVWLGYQYLRMVIRPRQVIDLFLLPINALCAWLRFRRCIHYAPADQIQTHTQPEHDYISKLVTQARFFFPAQVPHGWAENLMILGSWTKPLVRLFASLSLHLYRKAAATNQTMMASEYFWMRHLQARILAGHNFKRENVEQRLLEIENFFCDLHNDSHKMTVLMCRAFIEARYRSLKRTAVFLNQAEESILKRERFDATGALIRVLLYRRYFLNQPSLAAAVSKARAMINGKTTATARSS